MPFPQIIGEYFEQYKNEIFQSRYQRTENLIDQVRDNIHQVHWGDLTDLYDGYILATVSGNVNVSMEKSLSILVGNQMGDTYQPTVINRISEHINWKAVEKQLATLMGNQQYVMQNNPYDDKDILVMFILTSHFSKP